jgi:ATP-dependent Clp protease ATP-binding subunit ClpC
VLELAMAEARVARATLVDTQHLLLGLVREERGIAAQVLLDFGITADKARAELARLS